MGRNLVIHDFVIFDLQSENNSFYRLVLYESFIQATLRLQDLTMSVVQ
jgi:hypothetical protein